MRTKIDNLSLVCLEKDTKDGISYESSYKLDYDLYQKVIEQKIKRGLLSFDTLGANRVNENDVKEGDYVYLAGKSNGFGSTPLFGFVKKNDDGDLYVLSHKLKTGCDKRQSSTFVMEKTYITSKSWKPGFKSLAYDFINLIFKK